jgi:hypothetical protein
MSEPIRFHYENNEAKLKTGKLCALEIKQFHYFPRTNPTIGNSAELIFFRVKIIIIFRFSWYRILIQLY